MDTLDATFARQAILKAGAETDIIEALDRLVVLAQEASLADTIGYLACCRALVLERRKRRMAERH